MSRCLERASAQREGADANPPRSPHLPRRSRIEVINKHETTRLPGDVDIQRGDPLGNPLRTRGEREREAAEEEKEGVEEDERGPEVQQAEATPKQRHLLRWWKDSLQNVTLQIPLKINILLRKSYT